MNQLLKTLVGVLLVALTAPTLLAAENAKAPSREQPIKVGVLVSHFTATGPSWGAPYGYMPQVARLPEILAKDVELTPVIEPGTEKEGDMPTVLASFFRDRKPVSAFDPAELRKFDVILAYRQSNMKPETSAALVAAVKEGVGLVSQGCGSVTPGYTADNNLLTGLTDGEYGWNPGDVDCEIIGTHPLLGDLSGAVGTTFRARPNGPFGKLTEGSVPLIRAKDRSQIEVPRNKPVKTEFYPLYVSQLGKGRLVIVALSPQQPFPPELQAATGGKFFLRCIRYAANRPLDPEPKPGNFP